MSKTETTTRSEHHADSDDAEVRRAKDLIARELSSRTQPSEAVSSSSLAGKTTSLADGGVKPTTVRDIIPELRRERDLPIVSCSQGYYLIDNPSDLQRELDRMQDRIETVESRRRELAAAFNAHTRSEEG